MALPEFTMRQLLEAGVHYGHQTQRWNPRMAEFIYGERNGIHIFDLTQTVPMLDAALQVVRDTATAVDTQRKVVTLARGGSIGYDKLVVSPGVDLQFDAIEGLAAASASGQVL